MSLLTQLVLPTFSSFLFLTTYSFVSASHLNRPVLLRNVGDDCLGFFGTWDLTKKTVYEVLQDELGMQYNEQFDNDGTNYNMFSRLLFQVNLRSQLNDPQEQLTIIIVPDSGVNSSVQEIIEYYDIPGKLDDESKAFRILSKRLPQRYQSPVSVRAAIMRNHILSAKILPCRFTETQSWTTWANQNVSRSGYKIITEGSPFQPPDYDITFQAIEAKNGVIYQFDRLVMPDLSSFALQPSPSPTSSSSATASASPSFNAPSPSYIQPSASNSVLPPSPSQSSAVSTTPIPSLNNTLVMFSLEPSPHHSISSENQSDTPNTSPADQRSSRRACFPGNALVEISGSQVLPMHRLRVGQHVKSSISGDLDAVFMFSHFVSTTNLLPFLRIETASMYNVTLSDGHYLYVNGVLKAAEDARVGDWVMTDAGASKVRSIQRVWEKGLYAPHTLSGRLIVNGVLASCYTTVFPGLTGHTMLAPLRAVARSKLFKSAWKQILHEGGHGKIVQLWSSVLWWMSSE